MHKTNALNRALRLAFGGGLVAGAAALPAQAQVTITGSSIRQISSETALPVTVLKAADLAKAGVTNAEQALAFVTSNLSALNSARSVGESNGGASFADLRGLGPARTLVLLNGKRMVMNPYNSGSASGVDLNTIPFGAVDRIEVLNDGASALYGSDAIAGVVNFITRTEYQGVTLTGSAQLPTSSGGGQVYDIGVTGGIGSLSEQKWNLFGGLSYRQQQPLSALDRSFASSSEIPNRGVYFSSGTTFPANYSQSTLPNDTFNPSAPGCDPPNSLFGGDRCYFDYVRFLDIVPKQEQLSAIVKGTLAVDNDNTVSLEYVQGNNKLTSVTAPSAIFWYMPSTNPFYPGGPGLAGVPGTAGNSTPGFDPNADIDLGWRTTNMGSRVITFDTKTDRFLLDWQGSYNNWFYTAAVLQSNSNVKNTFNGGYVNEAAMRAGLDGSNIPGGSTAAPWLNPFGSQTADGQAYMNSQRIVGQVQQAEGKLFGVKAEANGEIYKLPAGPLTMGVGIEYYSDKATYTNNLALIRQAASSGLEGAEDSSGSRNWYGVYAEFNIPVVKTVDITLAARYDDYSDFGSTFNPKAAIRWAPTKELLLRGSWNSGFRAPSLYQAYSPTSFTNTQGNRLDDPVLCPGGVVDVAAGGVESRDCGTTFQQQQGGNKNLQPETSTAWSVGMVFQPTTTSVVSVDYWNYVVKDSISQLGESAIFGNPTGNANNFVRCSQLSAAEQAEFDACRIPGGDPLAYVVNTYLNLGSYKTSGIDFAANWRSAAYSYGRFSVGWQATWILDYEYQFEPSGTYNNNLGVYFNGQAIPRYRQFLNLGWQLQDWSANLINRYSRGYTDDNSFVAPEYYNTVGATNTWDLAVTWSGVKGLVLTAGLTNLFNQEPPFSNQGTTFQVGYDPRNASPIGRAFLLRGTYSF